METMLDLGVTGILEMPPAGTLTGIAKRAMKGVETFALKTPDQLDDARAFCDKHGEASPDRHHARPGGWSSPPPRAPSTSPSEAADARASSRPATPIGDVASLRDRTSVTAPHGGEVVEWLVEDGDLVSPGQPLLRLHPEGACLMSRPISDAPGARTPRSSGIGAYRPSRVVPNSEVVEAIDSSDEWIQQRSGIKQRRWADPEETVQMMSVAASRKALEHAGIDARADRLRHRRHRQPHAADPGHRHRDRPRARHRPGRGVRHLGRLRRASATASRWPPTWSAAAAPATSW